MTEIATTTSWKHEPIDNPKRIDVDSFVSWNFKHMVNFFRIRQDNSINLKFNYSTIDIRTPKEVTYGEQE